MDSNCTGDLSRQLFMSPYATSSALVEQAVTADAPIIPHFHGGRVLITAEIANDWDVAISSEIEVVLRGKSDALSRLVEKHRAGQLRYVVKYTAGKLDVGGGFALDDEPEDIEVTGMVDRYVAVRITRNQRLDCLSVELC